MNQKSTFLSLSSFQAFCHTNRIRNIDAIPEMLHDICHLMCYFLLSSVLSCDMISCISPVGKYLQEEYNRPINVFHVLVGGKGKDGRENGQQLL